MASEFALDHVQFSVNLDAVVVRKVERMAPQLGVTTRNAAIEKILRRATEDVQLMDEDIEWIESVIQRNRETRERRRARRKGLQP